MDLRPSSTCVFHGVATGALFMYWRNLMRRRRPNASDAFTRTRLMPTFGVSAGLSTKVQRWVFGCLGVWATTFQCGKSQGSAFLRQAASGQTAAHPQLSSSRGAPAGKARHPPALVEGHYCISSSTPANPAAASTAAPRRTVVQWNLKDTL